MQDMGNVPQGENGPDAESAPERDFQKEIDALKADLGKVRDDLMRLREVGGEAAEEAVVAARRRLEEEGSRLIERIRGIGGDAEGEARSFFREVEAEVGHRPMTALLASFGIGVLVGWMSRRK